MIKRLVIKRLGVYHIVLMVVMLWVVPAAGRAQVGHDGKDSVAVGMARTEEMADTVTYEHSELPEVAVRGVAKRKPIDMHIDMKEIKRNIQMQNPPRGFNILAPIFWAINKIFPHRHKETSKERAERLCEAY